MKKEYSYKYEIEPSDLWQASMYYTYSSYVAVINVCCIVASIALMVRFFSTAEGYVRVLLILFVMLFTVVQPMEVWFRANRQLIGKNRDVSIKFAEDGVHISSGGQNQLLFWKNIKGVVKKPTLIAVYVKDGNGYILNNKVLLDTKDEVTEYIKEKVTAAKSMEK